MISLQQLVKKRWREKLKVPTYEIFDRSDDFYTIKPFGAGDFGAKI